jgi:catalase
VEQDHIANAFRFELSKVTVPAIRERMVAMLRNASEELAKKVADGLGMDPLPEPLPLALPNPADARGDEVARAVAAGAARRRQLKGRKIALLVARASRARRCSNCRPRCWSRAPSAASSVRASAASHRRRRHADADASLENEPGFLFDALVLPDGAEAVAALAQDGHTPEFIKDQFRHCKTILVLGASRVLLVRRACP